MKYSDLCEKKYEWLHKSHLFINLEEFDDNGEDLDIMSLEDIDFEHLDIYTVKRVIGIITFFMLDEKYWPYELIEFIYSHRHELLPFIFDMSDTDLAKQPLEFLCNISNYVNDNSIEDFIVWSGNIDYLSKNWETISKNTVISDHKKYLYINIERENIEIFNFLWPRIHLKEYVQRNKYEILMALSKCQNMKYFDNFISKTKLNTDPENIITGITINDNLKLYLHCLNKKIIPTTINLIYLINEKSPNLFKWVLESNYDKEKIFTTVLLLYSEKLFEIFIDKFSEYKNLDNHFIQKLFNNDRTLNITVLNQLSLIRFYLGQIFPKISLIERIEWSNQLIRKDISLVEFIWDITSEKTLVKIIQNNSVELLGQMLTKKLINPIEFKHISQNGRIGFSALAMLISNKLILIRKMSEVVEFVRKHYVDEMYSDLISELKKQYKFDLDSLILLARYDMSYENIKSELEEGKITMNFSTYLTEEAVLKSQLELLEILIDLGCPIKLKTCLNISQNQEIDVLLKKRLNLKRRV